MPSFIRIPFVCLFFVLVFGHVHHLEAQEMPHDTIKLSIEGAEKQFLTKNLLLLAEKCNVDAAEAGIIQARLWPNPNLQVEQNIYNFETHKAFDFTKTGNTAITASQLFLMAGKRNKQVDLQKINLKKSEYIFYDLLRSLKFQLRTTFYDSYYLVQTLKVYDNEIQSLSKTIDVYQQQREKGNVLQMELTRLQAFNTSLQMEQNELRNKLFDKQSDLKVLLSIEGPFILPLLKNDNQLYPDVKNLKLQSLIDTAMNNRYDLKIQESNLDWAVSNHKLQQAMAYPDLNLNLQAWNRAGGYVRDYNSITVGVDIPILNRNQGNIKIAQSQVDNSKYVLENYKEVVKNDVMKAWSKALETEKLQPSQQSGFVDSYEKLTQEVQHNYEKRNISLLEFIDFYDSYKNFIIQHNNLDNNRIDTYEELNYCLGKTLVNH
ncbi:MAG: TolC family protein [Bacteroidota bacterium]